VAARNVISGNANGIFANTAGTETIIQGNYVGTNAAGSAAIANGFDGINIRGTTGTTIGGTAAGAGNLVRGNPRFRVYLFGADSATVQGNVSGLNAAGTAKLPNASAGVKINSGANNNLVGGTTAGAGNVISGNGFGISIDDSGGASNNTTIQGNKIGTNP